MLLIGIIKYLTISFPETKLAYFFCQGSNALMNSSNSVLRGLIYRLLCDQPSLIAHLREKYDRHKSMFQDGSSFFALSEVASHMLRDPEIGRIYIIIDALDECETNRNQILDFISQNLDVSPSVKWIVSTRKVPAIIDRLGQFNLNIQLHLDLADNTEDVSLAVNAYIIVKVASLPALRENNQQILHVQTVMHEKAANTFLWAALVFQELETAEEWDIFDIIDSIPSGLEDLYARMMDQIQKLGRGNSELCHKILATATLAHRPLFMAEIGALADLPDRIANIMERVRRIINMCGSFLRIQDDTVQFVHQSAKDYLNDTAGAIIFKSPQNDAHFRLYMRSIQLMSVNLSRNIYRLPYPGILIDDIQRPEPDPLGQLRYSCVYWVQHLCYGMQEITSIGVLRDGKELPTFFKQHLLHWLEALSLMGAMGEGISAIIRLQTALKASSMQLIQSGNVHWSF
ncbi:hypothetical protein N7456_000272 [Penicillium angulare]|uniref:Nephrocystin 3-like N-terminal domain-containing protein n=1 Tax=Penicillium angulare TaxID=116970 RepID=A0A9W9KS27_9EURO|nr:hypothetical protein N7456_000272 [Penicillium angulare]